MFEYIQLRKITNFIDQILPFVRLNEEYIVHIGKKGFKDMSFQDIIKHREDQLTLLEWEGLNPYKAYELFKNFRPYVPVECQSDPMYAKPSPEVLAKVKAEKLDRKVFREELKKKKYTFFLWNESSGTIKRRL